MAWGQGKSTAALDTTPAPLDFGGVERFAVKEWGGVFRVALMMPLPVRQVALIGIVARNNPDQAPTFPDHRDQGMITRKPDRIGCGFHEGSRLGQTAAVGRLT